jgi:hypothetical protein
MARWSSPTRWRSPGLPPLRHSRPTRSVSLPSLTSLLSFHCRGQPGDATAESAIGPDRVSGCASHRGTAARCLQVAFPAPLGVGRNRL